jgi:hypothetical protein
MAFVKSIPQISNLFVLMFLMMFIFALLGMQMFGGTFDPIEDDVRGHFDYIGPSMITVFLVMTGGWVDAYQVCGEFAGVPVATAFFVAVVITEFSSDRRTDNLTFRIAELKSFCFAIRRTK